jgi:hypothetical protein
MIWFFTPYSFEKRLFDAWDKYMNLIQDKEDWACMMDGDVAFFRNDFGHHIREYIDKYPGFSLFSCYASRSGTDWMLPKDHQFSSQDIIVHKKLAEKYFVEQHLGITDLNNRVTGHLMVIQKKTWLNIRDEVKRISSDRTLLGVDTIISRQVLATGGKVGLMQGIYVFHYYRHLEGRSNKSHLL